MVVGFGTSHKVSNILIQPGKFADTSAVSLKLPDTIFKTSWESYYQTAHSWKVNWDGPTDFLWELCKKVYDGWQRSAIASMNNI